MIKKKLLKGSKVKCHTLFHLLHIRFASVDMELHTTYDPNGSLSIHNVDQRVSEQTQVLAPLPEDKFLCSFRHIFAGLECFNQHAHSFISPQISLTCLYNPQEAMQLDTTVTR
ncbi:hypothetical protein ABZP36_032888 [Zizania latifolia]